MENYDLIIIGAGPGGYVAAERAAADGQKVLLVEKSHLGGVCLNEGCIPSKTLLYSAKLFQQAQHASLYGIEHSEPTFTLATAMARKEKVMQTLRKGIAGQMKRHKVTVVAGHARLVDARTVAVDDQQFAGRHILIATGSSPIRPPIPGADQDHVMTSTEILNISELPTNVAIVGGGVIGLEFASFLSGVGCKVRVIEMLADILPNMDADLSKMLRRALPNVDFHLGARLERIGKDDVTFSVDGKEESAPADLVLMAIGRRPNTQNLGLEAAGVDTDRRGIRVDDHMRTNIPSIYAVGDVTGLSPLAHSASRMGEVAVNCMQGRADRMRYHAIPWVVYTYPELAGVGLTEAAAQEAGREVETAQMQMRANGRFIAEHEKDNGLCKVVVDKQSRVLLGVHMIGAHASEMIYGAAAMIEAELRVQDIREIVFPHPTVAEVFRESVFQFH